MYMTAELNKKLIIVKNNMPTALKGGCQCSCFCGQVQVMPIGGDVRN